MEHLEVARERLQEEIEKEDDKVRKELLAHVRNRLVNIYERQARVFRKHIIAGCFQNRFSFLPKKGFAD